MDINFLVSKFEEEYKEESYAKKIELRNKFAQKFPLESIKNMDLDDYALGRKHENLCWWIEYNTIELGSIKGGSAYKHKIYYAKKDNTWHYPDNFQNETEAWYELRKALYNFLKSFQETGNCDIEKDDPIYSMNMVRTKLLYMYFQDKVLPMYSDEHVHKALEFFGYKEDDIKDWDAAESNIELKKVKDSNDIFKNWNEFKFVRFIYDTIIRNSKVYKIAPGDNAMYWNECFRNGYICIGWDEVGDLNNYADYDEFKQKFGEIFKDYNKSKVTQKANEMWTFFELNTGDRIVANKGISTILGVGTVNEKVYEYDDSRQDYKHIVYVDWDKNFNVKNIPEQGYWAFRTVYNISEKLYNEIVDDHDNNHIDTDNNQKQVVPVSDKDKEADTFTEAEEKFFLKMDKNLSRKGNAILYGPPGTGKTYLSTKFLKWKNKNADCRANMEFCTFHPSFTYEDFIEGYKPYKDDKDEMKFKLTDGIFKNLCNKAKIDKGNNYYLIIDEINRGNIEKIFGEMITVIEADKRGMTLTLSQSHETFYVPENVYIIGTMNTSDRSIKMLDAALRRRFAFIECMPDYELINKSIENLGLSPKDILMRINEKLRLIEDRDKQIGHSYFMKKGQQISTVDELKEVYIYDIIPLISEYCFNDYNKISEIVGEDFVDEDREELKSELLDGTDDYFISEIMKKFGEKNA